EDGIRDFHVTGVQTCALPIYLKKLIYTAKELRHKNVFSQILNGKKLPDSFIEELKKFDHFFNVVWPLTHYKTATHYLNTPESKRSEERRVRKECRSR